MQCRRPNFQADEDDLLRAHYLKRGAGWCAQRLQGRSENSIHNRARRLGIARCAADLKRPTTDLIDERIRRAYTGERPKGFVSQCATAVGRPRDWVAKRALELGLIQARSSRPWTDEELSYASKWPLVSPRDLSRRMRRLGWERTPSAIAHMRTAGNIERTDDARFTAAGLAEAMGVSPTTISVWISKGLLRASRRGWDRTEAQHGDGYVIHERDVAAFIVQHTAHISLTKLEPNKFWLIDLLVRCGAPATATGRQKRDTVLQIAEARPDLSSEQIAQMTDSTANSVSVMLSRARAAARKDAAA